MTAGGGGWWHDSWLRYSSCKCMWCSVSGGIRLLVPINCLDSGAERWSSHPVEVICTLGFPLCFSAPLLLDPSTQPRLFAFLLHKRSTSTQLCPFSSLLHNPSPTSLQSYLRGIFDRPWSKLIERSVLISKYTPLPTKTSLIFESLPLMISSLLLIPFLSTDHQVWIHCLSWIQCKLGHYAYAWMYFHSFAEDREDPN